MNSTDGSGDGPRIVTASIRVGREMLAAPDGDVYVDVEWRNGVEDHLGFTEDAAKELYEALEAEYGDSDE